MYKTAVYKHVDGNIQKVKHEKTAKIMNDDIAFKQHPTTPHYINF